MEHKIIVIDLSSGVNDTLTDKHKDLLKDLQTELFKNGYKWVNSKVEVQNFYSSRGCIVLIDNTIYKMTEDSIKYLTKDNKVHFVGNVVSYFRYLKLKKLKLI